MVTMATASDPSTTAHTGSTRVNAAWLTCSRAVSLWTLSPLSRLESRRMPARSRSWRSSGCPRIFGPRGGAREWGGAGGGGDGGGGWCGGNERPRPHRLDYRRGLHPGYGKGAHRTLCRSEEHTSELQSPDHLLFPLLLSKKTH